LNYALLSKRVIVIPLSEDRVPSTRTLNIVVAASGMDVLLIVTVVLDVARLYGCHVLSIYLPLFVGLFVCGVLYMGKAITQL